MFRLEPIDSDAPIERQGTDRRFMESRGLEPFVMDFYAFDGDRPDNDPCVWFPEGKLPGFG